MSNELLCPIFLYGDYRSANATAGRFVTKIHRGRRARRAATLHSRGTVEARDQGDKTCVQGLPCAELMFSMPR